MKSFPEKGAKSRVCFPKKDLVQATIYYHNLANQQLQ